MEYRIIVRMRPCPVAAVMSYCMIAQCIPSSRGAVIMSSWSGLPVAEGAGSPSADEQITKPSTDHSTRKYVKYSTAMNRWFLRPIGIWPVLPNAGTAEKVVTEIQIVSCYFLICFLLVPCALHTFFDESDPTLRLKMIGPLSFCLMAIIKYCFLVQRRDEISVCLAHIAKDWSYFRSPGDREIMLKDAKFGRFVASLCAAFMYGGGFFYHTIMPLSCDVIVTEQNVSLRPLTYPVYDTFFDAQLSPTYEIVFATQWFSGFVIYTVTIGACSIAAVFSMHACGQFKVLINRLHKLVDGDGTGDDDANDRMADIVEIHLRVLGFVGRVEGVLNEVCLVEFIGCTMNICFLGYYFMTEWERSAAISTVTYCVLLVSFTFNILIFCYIGEMLTEQSKRIGTVTYMIDWYRLRGNKARDLILVLVMSRYPASITAGKMAELSLSSFCGVLKTALTYLNLLRTVAG